ncbi:hypothetical protein QJS66_03775 [Kocuria rhizophila]|nr:hypothetical protein QJS66_03775 [Kocuria rhizophila]
MGGLLLPVQRAGRVGDGPDTLASTPHDRALRVLVQKRPGRCRGGERAHDCRRPRSTRAAMTGRGGVGRPLRGGVSAS